MGNLTLEDVNNMYLDVLKEIGNIGAGNATTAIANMLGMKIDMNVPNVKLMEVSKLGTAVGAEDETIVGIFLEVMNDIEGSMMFLVDIPSARYLVNKLMMEDVPADKPFDEMELSALKEIGNIIAGSYLSAHLTHYSTDGKPQSNEKHFPHKPFSIQTRNIGKQSERFQVKRQERPLS